MNDIKIAIRATNSGDFTSFAPLRVGMCITTRVNLDYEPITNFSLPFHDFVYIVTRFDKSFVYLVDTSHNNTTSISVKDLETCELVSEFHKNNLQVDCDHINRVLSGDYDY